MGKLSRDKGARWEREVARLFKGKRTAPMQAGHAEAYPDVVSERFCIECKCGKSWNEQAALDQAVAAASYQDPRTMECPFITKTPIAVCKEDRRRPVVVTTLSALVNELGPSTSAASKSEMLVTVDLYDFLEEFDV